MAGYTCPYFKLKKGHFLKNEYLVSDNFPLSLVRWMHAILVEPPYTGKWYSAYLLSVDGLTY